MAKSKTIREQNEELARAINTEARADPGSPYAGKFVGIANGKVVIVTDDLDELDRCLSQADPDPGKTCWIEASVDYSEIHEIWSLG
jgi:hypothetical protein